MLRSALAIGFAVCMISSASRAQQEDNILSPKYGMTLRARIQNFECKPLVAKNETSSPITIQKIDSGKAVETFKLTNVLKLPHRLNPGESVSLGYACFHPDLPNKEYARQIHIIFSSNKRVDTSIVSLHAISDPVAAALTDTRSTTPGAVITFDPLTTKEGTLLAMTGKDDEFSRSFTFKNTSTGIYTVNAIDFEKQDAKFEVSSIEPDGSFPFDVQPGESFSVRIIYHSFDRIPSYNHLRISTKESKEPVTYEVRGFQLPLSEMDWNKKKDSAQDTK
jgi:hypothetical protein